MKTRATQGGPPSAAVVPGNAAPANPAAAPISPTPATAAEPPPGRTKAGRSAKAPGARSATKPSGKPAKGASKPGVHRAAPHPGKAKAGAAKPPPRKRHGLSGLDAAAKVLAGAGKPMRCAEIVERVLARGLWKSGGKTPGATMNAAMIREIRDKGKQSRFRKAARGLFVSPGKGR